MAKDLKAMMAKALLGQMVGLLGESDGVREVISVVQGMDESTLKIERADLEQGVLALRCDCSLNQPIVIRFRDGAGMTRVIVAG
jgi:hypothetical protein